MGDLEPLLLAWLAVTHIDLQNIIYIGAPICVYMYMYMYLGTVDLHVLHCRL